MICDLTSVEVLLERIKLPVKTLPGKSAYGNTPLVLCGQGRTSNMRSGNARFDLIHFLLEDDSILSNQNPVEVDLSLSTEKRLLV